MPSNVCGKITDSSPNFYGCTFQVWECLGIYIPHFTEHVITYLCWELSYAMLVKGASGVIWYWFYAWWGKLIDQIDQNTMINRYPLLSGVSLNLVKFRKKFSPNLIFVMPSSNFNASYTVWTLRNYNPTKTSLVNSPRIMYGDTLGKFHWLIHFICSVKYQAICLLVLFDYSHLNILIILVLWIWDIGKRTLNQLSQTDAN